MFVLFWYVLHAMERAVKGRPYLVMMFPAMGVRLTRPDAPMGSPRSSAVRVWREWASPLSGGSAPQITILLAFLPLVLFCCYQEDFGNLNVLKPKDYLFLVRKTYSAIRDNNWKITAKVQYTHTHSPMVPYTVHAGALPWAMSRRPKRGAELAFAGNRICDRRATGAA